MWLSKYAWSLPRGFIAYMVASAFAYAFADGFLKMFVLLFGLPLALSASLWLDGFFKDPHLVGGEINENDEDQEQENENNKSDELTRDDYIRDRSFGEIFDKNNNKVNNILDLDNKLDVERQEIDDDTDDNVVEIIKNDETVKTSEK